MIRPRWRIGAELLPVLLVLVCLGGSLALVMVTHRRFAPQPKRPAQVVMAPAVEPEPTPAPEPAPAPPAPEPEPDPEPPAPADDPTPRIVSRLAAQTDEERKAAAEADRRAEALGQARRTAEAESAKWKRREMLVRGQVDALERKVQVIETEAETLALEHDVLVRQRDDARSALLKARARAGSFAVLPYKGPTGTWQRPIVIECRDGSAALQPNGPSFSLLDIAGMGGSVRADPFISAIAHELLKVQGAPTPDGAPSVPYILFVVRPDGIRPYYAARTRLEPLGIAFGYELVETEQDIDYPDLDDLAEWNDAVPGSSRPGGPLAQRWPRTSGGNGGEATEPPPAPASAPGTGPYAGGLAGGPGGGAIGGMAEGSGPAGGSGSGISGGGSLDWPSSPPGRYGNVDPRAGSSAIDRALSGPPARRYANQSVPLADDPATADPPGSAVRRRARTQPGQPDARGRVEIVPTDPQGAPGARPRGGFNRWASLDELRAAAEGPGAGPGSGAGNVGSPDGQPTGTAPPVPGRSLPLPARTDDGTLLADRRQASGAAPSSGSAGAYDPSRPPSQGSLPLRPEDDGPPGLPPVPPPPPPQGAGSPGDPGSAPSPSTSPSRRGSSGGMPQAPASSSVFGGGNMAGVATGTPVPLSLSNGQAGSQSQLDDLPLPRPSAAENHVPEAALQLVVVCTRDGITIEPGGRSYRLNQLTRDGRLLLNTLEGIVRARQVAQPLTFWHPRVHFLIEPGGDASYREARRQTVLAGNGWPVTLQVASSDGTLLHSKERR